VITDLLNNTTYTRLVPDTDLDLEELHNNKKVIILTSPYNLRQMVKLHKI